MTTTILWPTNSTFDRIVARSGDRMSTIGRIGKKRPVRMGAIEFLSAKRVKGFDVTVELTRSEGYFDRFRAGGTSMSDVKKLIENEASKLSPVSSEEIELVPLACAAADGFNLLQVRQDLVLKLERQARKLGLRQLFLSPEDFPELTFEAPAFTKQTRVSRKLNAAAWVLVLAGVCAGLSAWADRQEAAADFARAHEQSLRAAVMARNDVSSEVQAFELLAQRNPTSTSPQGIIERLAELTMATPSSTWWSELQISADGMTVSAISQDAGESLQDLSHAYPEHAVRFSGAVNDLSEGRQSFTVEIREAQDE